MATVTDMLQAQKVIHKALAADHSALTSSSEKLRHDSSEKESTLRHKDAQISLLRDEIEEYKRKEGDRAKEVRADDAAWRQVSVCLSETLDFSHTYSQTLQQQLSSSNSERLVAVSEVSRKAAELESLRRELARLEERRTAEVASLVSRFVEYDV